MTPRRSHVSGCDPEATPPSVTSSHCGGMMSLNEEEEETQQQVSAKMKFSCIPPSLPHPSPSATPPSPPLFSIVAVRILIALPSPDSFLFISMTCFA